MLSALIFMVSLTAGVFAQDPVQPEITAPQETKTEVKKEEKAKAATVPFTIGEIVVRDRAVPNIEDASTTTVVDGKEIEQRGDKALSETLNMVPGLTADVSRKGFTFLNMRGFDHQRVAIMIDGIPIIEPYYGGNNIDVSAISVQNVSKVIVNRGAASALYGALGSVGSINIISSRPEKLFTQAKAEYGEHANWTINASGGAPIGDLYFWITASVQNSGGYEISKKLTESERRSWFEKLVSNDVYATTIPAATTANMEANLSSVQNYFKDDGVWNNTSFRKYNTMGRIGYKISHNMETGLSVYYYTNRQESNSFSDGTQASWDGESSWRTPTSSGTTKYGNAYMYDSAKSAFQNRAWLWPEDSRLTIAPYFRADINDLSIKFNVFYSKQRNELEPYFEQNRDTAPTFPPSSVGHPTINYWDGTNQVSSNFEETAWGFFLMPSYKFGNWNTLSACLHYRFVQHEKTEQALQNTSVVVTTVGSGELLVDNIEASYLTVAIEDQMRFNTPVGRLSLTAGISYDAQSLITLESYDAGMRDFPMPEDENTIWGTNDSFNPVLAAVLDPIRDLLRLRTAFAMKTNFPTLSVLSDISELIDDNEPGVETVRPERIYNYNAGFELFFLNNALSFRSDYFFTIVKDKIVKLYDPTADTDLYYNIEGYTSQGIESTLQTNFSRVAGIVDIQCALSYVFNMARNDDTSYATKGEDVENTPQHQIILQLVFDFITNTRVNIWGVHTRNQITYVMASNPAVTTPTAFTTDVYTTQQLHNPFMLNVKIQQELPFNTYVYAMCKNVLDDYNADPFNPGPGRMFYFGGGGRL